MGKRRKFPDEYKREAVRLATQPGVLQKLALQAVEWADMRSLAFEFRRELEETGLASHEFFYHAEPLDVAWELAVGGCTGSNRAARWHDAHGVLVASQTTGPPRNCSASDANGALRALRCP